MEHPVVRRLLHPLLKGEQHFRDAILTVDLSLSMLEQRIDQIDSGFQPKPDQCWIGRRFIQVSSLFGDVRVERDYYLGIQGGIARPMPRRGRRKLPHRASRH